MQATAINARAACQRGSGLSTRSCVALITSAYSENSFPTRAFPFDSHLALERISYTRQPIVARESRE